MTPLRVLVVADFTTQPCGIRNFADQTVTALRRHPDLEVDTWDAYYPEIYRRQEAHAPAYLPADAWTYDVIHFNWHPVACNTYNPEHFPDGPILSVYLHDTPQWSTCPFFDRAQVRLTAEPAQGCYELPYPIADWIPDLPDPDPDFTVGCSTLRGDGVAAVEAACQARGWAFRQPDRSQGWASFEDEVKRQARNTINVLWYQEERGRSGGLSQALASGRPVIISDSVMFDHYRGWDFRDGIFRPLDDVQTLPDLLEVVHSLWQLRHLHSFSPRRIQQQRSWSWATDSLVELWRAARLA